MKNRKGVNASVVMGLAISILAFAIMGIIVVVGQAILVGVQSTQTSATAPWYVIANATAGVGNVAQQLPLMGTIMVFGAIISLLLAVFWFRKGGL